MIARNPPSASINGGSGAFRSGDISLHSFALQRPTIVRSLPAHAGTRRNVGLLRDSGRIFGESPSIWRVEGTTATRAILTKLDQKTKPC